MVTRLTRRVLALCLALVFVATTGADEPKKQPDPDALPKGAKLRLGDGRMAFTHAQGVQLLPPDYKVFVLPDGYSALRAYELATGRPVDPAAKPTQNFGGASGVVISGDGKRFVGSHTGILTVRETATGKEVKQLKPPVGFSTVSVFNAPTTSLSADGKVMAQGGTGVGNKGGIVVWNVDKGVPIFQTGVALDGPAIPVISPDGKTVAVRGTGYSAPGAKPEDDPRRTVWVYAVEGGKELLRATATQSGPLNIAAVAFSPDGSTLAVSSGDGVIDLWDVKEGKAKQPLLGCSEVGKFVAFSPDGKRLAAVATDGTVQRWELADGKALGTTPGPAIPFLMPKGLAFADNDRVRAWGSTIMCPVVWEAPSGKTLTPVPEHTYHIQSIAFAKDGKEVLTSAADYKIVRWDAATGKALGTVKLHPRNALSGGTGRVMARLTPDGTRAISTGSPAAVFDLATGLEDFAIPRGEMANHSTSSFPSADLTKVCVVAVPSDPTKLARCVVWDLAARKKLAEVEFPAATGLPPHAAISPSGKRLVTTAYMPNPPGGQQTLLVTGWDVKTGKRLAQAEDATSRGLAFVAAASDSFAVVATEGGRLKAYDYEVGKFGDEFAPRNMRGISPTLPVLFSPDGKHFAAAATTDQPNAYAVKVREWPSGKVTHTFEGFRSPVSAMTFSPDGKTLATGSHDTTVMLWDLGEGK